MRGFSAIGLDNPKNPINVGAVLRAAGCYDASLVAISGARSTQAMGRLVADTTKSHRRIPVLRGADLHDLIPYDCVPVAVDLVDDATPLHLYQHPERAFYVFGAEDATLGNRVLSWCRDRIYVPTNGCMNLAATVNVILYDRLAKQMLRQQRKSA